ncbi:MAG: hypothetical protein JWN73_4356 [Betaproteobacteria bacterium]|nr:hypothetical protein [Betaproteobacteria bacterium]
MSTPQAVLASAATRAPVVGVIADTYNTGRVAFTNSEFADLGKTAAAMPAQERGPFFQQLADTLKDPDLVRATFKRLGADSPVLAENNRGQTTIPLKTNAPVPAAAFSLPSSPAQAAPPACPAPPRSVS